MTRIFTVDGPIRPEELGFCQSHEHLAIARAYPSEISPEQRIDDPEASARELAVYREAGGGAVVDAQPVGCGRDPQILEQLSRRSGVHIIASTGFHKMLFYPEDHWIYRWSADELTRLYLSELDTGMYLGCDRAEPQKQSAIRVGQIKAALDAGPLTPQYEKLFDAAGNAAASSGSPLMVHIESGSDPTALARTLLDKGVAPDRLIFCHMDRSVPDLQLHKDLGRQGIYLEYDTIARPKYHDDERELEIIESILEAGLEDRLLMGLDVTRARFRSYGNPGAPGLDYIHRVFLPKLRRFGVAEAQLQQIFFHNPARVFAYRD